MANVVFKSTANLQEGMKVECMNGNHKFILDEPVELGGTNCGMNPVEALLSALGACKCIVARCFAKSQGVDLQELRIELEGDLDPNGFMGKDKDAKIGFSEIRTNIYIKSSSSEEKIKKFAEFIDRTCPVADTIVNTPTLKTEIIIEK